MKSTKIICPRCGAIGKAVKQRVREEVSVRGEPITLELEALRCEECGEEFYDPNDGSDVLDVAYREYRNRHGMVQPEEIRAFRRRHALTQQELSQLLGWGGATISRYENGALQDKAHDKVLKLAMEPANLARLIQDNAAALEQDKRRLVLELLEKSQETPPTEIKGFYEELFGSYSPDEFSGFSRLHVDKVLNSILFFCLGEGVLKTKLNKLLFYADFSHFRDYATPITGARYVHLAFGPVLDNYEFYLATMIHEDNSLVVEERRFHDYLGEGLTSTKSPNLRIFSTSEVKALSLIKEKFESYTASKISEMSHQERAFHETSELDFISYEYAESISA